MNIVLVKSLEKKFDKFEKNTKSSALKILKILKKDSKIVEIYLIGNREIKRLNKEFRGKDKTTNILSFEQPKGFIDPLVRGFTQIGTRIYADKQKKKLGEIYLNIFLTKEGKRGEDLFSIDELLIHGVLHLLGYDHLKKMDSEKMERVENKVLKIINK